MNESGGENKLSGDERLSLIYNHLKVTQVSQVELFCAELFAGSHGAWETQNNQVCLSPSSNHILINSMSLEEILMFTA